MAPDALHPNRTKLTDLTPRAMAKRSFTVTMEHDLQTEIDRVAAQEDRSRNYVINHLCRVFLSQGAMHPMRPRAVEGAGQPAGQGMEKDRAKRGGR